MTEKSWQHNENMLFDKPNSDSNVWPYQCCPVFTPRSEGCIKECWYCRYADFHLDRAKSVDIGICCWPRDGITMVSNNL